jgi:shikimate kinase
LQSTIIYLQVPLEAIYERVEDFENRGFAKHPDQTIEEVYRERVSLYERYTDLTIENINSADICIEAIIKKLK